MIHAVGLIGVKKIVTLLNIGGGLEPKQLTIVINSIQLQFEFTRNLVE